MRYKRNNERQLELFPVTDSKAGLLKAGFRMNLGLRQTDLPLIMWVIKPNQINEKEVNRSYSAMEETRN
jgi:hypothetical protein